VIGCTIGSKGEVPGERKPVIRDNDDDTSPKIINVIIGCRKLKSKNIG
jgi:hypothetical protein